MAGSWTVRGGSILLALLAGCHQAPHAPVDARAPRQISAAATAQESRPAAREAKAHVAQSAASQDVAGPVHLTVAQDPVLTAIRSGLPNGWKMEIQGDLLVIERQTPVWVMYENKINSAVSRETQAQHEARIREHGHKDYPAILFRLQARWTTQRQSSVRESNAQVRSKIAKLVSKYGVEDVLDRAMHTKRGSLTMVARPEEQDKVAAYEQERKQLEGSIVELPVWQTSKLALFQSTHRAWSDSFNSVAPFVASEECYAVDSKLQKLLSTYAIKVSRGPDGR